MTGAQIQQIIHAHMCESSIEECQDGEGGRCGYAAEELHEKLKRS